MNEQDFQSPLKDKEGEWPSSFPDSFCSPEKKDRAYDLMCAKAIWYNNFRSFSNAFGNPYRAMQIDNCMWARGTQSQIDFAARPGVKNDKDVNPLLRHIDFDPVNEIVRHCDEYATRLEESDFSISAQAINPAAAVSKQDKVNKAEAYRQLKPVLDKLNQMAGANIAPKNPSSFEFESQREAEIFYNLGDKGNGELMVEVGNEVVMNENNWSSELKKMLVKDFRDIGYGIFINEVDTRGKIRKRVANPLNSGWEEFEGPICKRISKFWTITLKTGAQIIAESGGTLTKEDVVRLAQYSQGRFSNPAFPTSMGATGPYGYINKDNPNGLIYFFESWKFPVLEAWWEDWYIQDYRRIKEVESGKTVAFTPMPYGYEDSNGGGEYRNTVNGKPGPLKKNLKEQTFIHQYRQCKWVIGTDAVYMNGPVPFSPRDPRDVCFALSPITLYRASQLPYTQRIKPIGKMMQNAWNSLQNEMAVTVPHGYAYNMRAIDKITEIDGMKVKRMHIIEMHRRDGSILWSSAGATVNADGTPNNAGLPITPNPPFNMVEFEKWTYIINWCQAKMQTEGGFVDMQNKPAQDLSVFQSKLMMKSSNESMGQVMDGMTKIYEEAAISTVGQLQLLVKKGYYKQYVSGIGMSLLKPLSIDENIVGEYALRIEAKLTGDKKQELKAIIAQAFSIASNPAQGSPYLADLMLLNSWIDGDVNPKIICLMASYLQKKNMEAMTQQATVASQENAKANMAAAQQAAQLQLQQAQQLSALKMQENDHETQNAMKLLQYEIQLKTQGSLVTGDQKAQHKLNEIVTKEAVAA